MNRISKALLTLILAGYCTLANAAEWPQWRGPNRDGKSSETGLMKEWPADGPKLLWHTSGLGSGWSTAAIANNKIYITGAFNKKTETLFCMDMAGNILWQTEYGPCWTKSFQSSRTTPTIDNGLAYVLSSGGYFACIDANSGLKKWGVDLRKEYGAQNNIWGMAESPLIVDDMVICTPCGPKATMVAFNKKTGKEIWKTTGLPDKPSYCSALLVNHNKRKMIVTMIENNIIGVDAKTGKLLWTSAYKNKCYAHPNTPIYHDGRIYAVSGYDYKGVMLELSKDGTSVKTLWEDSEMDTHHGGVILIDGRLYGSSWKGNQNGSWLCLDWKTGNVLYTVKWKNKGSLTYADGMLYAYEEKGGTVGLVKLSKKEFKPISTFSVTKGSGEHWAHPVVSGGRLYIRHGDTLMSYDIKAKP